MAKVGEGDPRWLVQNREDGKNVNNWHWAETDCMNWAKKRLTALLSELTFLDDPSQGFCKTTSVQSISGECTANVRKGKTIFYYEIDVKVDWEGRLNGADILVKGQLHIPYISEENDDDKAEVTVSCESGGPAHDRLLELVKTKGIPLVREKVAQFLKDLRAEFTVKKVSEGQKTQQPQQTQQQDVKKAFKEGQAAQQQQAPKSKGSFKTIKLKEEFKASPNDVYNLMINPQLLNALTQGSALMNPTEGGTFALFNGVVMGENVKLVPGSKIVQKWRFSSWPEGHYSTVTIDIKPGDGSTTLTLTQEGVPSEDAERTEEGWRKNLWGRGKMMFGYGPASSVF
jgi:activator of HSP90 ATPase